MRIDLESDLGLGCVHLNRLSSTSHCSTRNSTGAQDTSLFKMAAERQCWVLVVLVAVEWFPSWSALDWESRCVDCLVWRTDGTDVWAISAAQPAVGESAPSVPTPETTVSSSEGTPYHSWHCAGCQDDVWHPRLPDKGFLQDNRFQRWRESLAGLEVQVLCWSVETFPSSGCDPGLGWGQIRSTVLQTDIQEVASKDNWLDMAIFNTQLHGDLVSLMEERTEGFEIVRNTKAEVGLDAWRRPNHKYDPRSPLRNI